MIWVDVIGENCARVDGRKWWHMLVPHDSHRQKSHCLTRHLEFPQKNATSLQCRRFLWAHECFCLRKSHVLTERVPSLWADFLAWHSHFFAEVLYKFLQPSLAAVAMASPFWSGLAPESCIIQALGIIWEEAELNWIGWGWWMKCKSYWSLSSRGPRGTHC